MNSGRKNDDTAEVLYLSFDGMTDPLGRSQVLPYLMKLAELGHKIRIVSLEKRAQLSEQAGTVRAICEASGMDWHPLPYLRRPPVVSALMNLRAIKRTAGQLHRQRPADFVHCRSDLPGIAGLELKRKRGLRLLYDMRAFFPDERAEGGAWDQSKPLYRMIFRYFKRRQRELIEGADAIVALSEAGSDEVRRMTKDEVIPPITVIPCCADFDLFVPQSAKARAEARTELGIDPATRVIIHVGSIGCNCMLEEMLDFFRVYRGRHPSAQMLFLAPSGELDIRARARVVGVDEAVHFRTATREDVPFWLGSADIGLMFVRPVWSKRAASPTKFAEMLAAGVPVIANAGIGDVTDIIRRTGGGVVIDRFDHASYEAAIERLDRLAISSARIRQGGRKYFDLQAGVRLYDQIYRLLASPRNQAQTVKGMPIA